MLDVSRSDADPITVADIEAADGEVRAGDIVLMYTGWGRKYRDDAYHQYPWLASEVGEWLIHHDVKLLGTDTLSPDRPRARRPDGWAAYPIHRQLLAEGILIAEHLGSLDAVAGERLEIYGFPIKSEDDGAPARFVARTRSGPTE